MSALKSRAASAGSVQWGWASTQVATLSGSTTVIFLTFFFKIEAELARNVAFQRGEFGERARGHIAQNDDLFLLERRPFGLDRGIERLEKISERPRVAARDRDQARARHENDGGEPHHYQ